MSHGQIFSYTSARKKHRLVALLSSLIWYAQTPAAMTGFRAAITPKGGQLMLIHIDVLGYQC